MSSELITSSRNPRVIEAAGLVRSRARRTSGRHLAEGPNAVVAAIRAGCARVLLATEEGRQLVEELLGDDRDVLDALEVLTVTDGVVRRIADAVNPQPVVAVVETPSVALDGLVAHQALVLDRVTDPGNVGTLLRSAQAFGVDVAICLEGGADPYGPKAVRSSAGSVYALPVVAASVAELVSWARATQLPLVGLDGNADASIHAWEGDRHRWALIVGSEAHGLAPDLLSHLDDLRAIPTVADVDSLNAAVAGSIAMFALTQARDETPSPGQ